LLSSDFAPLQSGGGEREKQKLLGAQEPTETEASGGVSALCADWLYVFFLVVACVIGAGATSLSSLLILVVQQLEPDRDASTMVRDTGGVLQWC